MNTYPNLAKRHKVAYIGTYPPKECGIATFTMDLVNATDLSGWRSVVGAVDDARPDSPHPDSKVIETMEKENRDDYKRVARLLARQNVSLLCIQHEYGIYGGDHGEYVVDLARAATAHPEGIGGTRRVLRGHGREGHWAVARLLRH